MSYYHKALFSWRSSVYFSNTYVRFLYLYHHEATQIRDFIFQLERSHIGNQAVFLIFSPLHIFYLHFILTALGLAALLRFSNSFLAESRLCRWMSSNFKILGVVQEFFLLPFLSIYDFSIKVKYTLSSVLIAILRVF